MIFYRGIIFGNVFQKEQVEGELRRYTLETTHKERELNDRISSLETQLKAVEKLYENEKIQLQNKLVFYVITAIQTESNQVH